MIYRKCLILLVFLLCSCKSGQSSRGLITIRNDVLDKEYNVIVVDQVISKVGVTNFQATLRPGDEVTIPQKKVRSIRLHRDYQDYTRIYEVQCPTSLKQPITMKLIDIHLNKVSGGCRLTRRGKQEHGGYVKWE